MSYDEQGHEYHMVKDMLQHFDLWIDNQVPGILPWHLLAAQCRWESSFDPMAVSSEGAKGIAQFMPETWAEIGHGDPFDARESVEAQSKYMLYLAMLHAETNKTAPFWWVASYTWGFAHVRAITRAGDLPREVWAHCIKIIKTSGYYRRLMRYSQFTDIDIYAL